MHWHSDRVITAVVVIPLVLAVLFVITARGRARQQGAEFPVRRAMFVVAVAGIAGAVAAALALLALNTIVPT